MSDEDIENKLKVENQYRTIAAEKYGTNDWYVYYKKNSDDGSYEPVFYKKDELENNDYDNKTSTSLVGVKSYVWGQSFETREIKDTYAKLSADSSDRYQTVTIFNNNDVEYRVDQIDARTVEEITRGAAYYEQQPQYDDYVYDIVDDPELDNAYLTAANTCRNNAINGQAGCYLHVLGHMLDLSLNDDHTVDTSAYPKTYQSSISTGADDVSVEVTTIRDTAIYGVGGSDHTATYGMVAVSEAMNSYQPADKTQRCTIMASEYTATDTEADKYLSSYYISQENPTNIQILLSNYYKDSDGNITIKTLKQKIIDLYKMVTLYKSNSALYGGTDFYYNILLNSLLSLDDDMQHFTLRDEEGFRNDTEEWEDAKPEKADPVYKDVDIYTLSNNKGITYNLTVTTIADEKGYNDAMNQYLYDKSIYDKKIQETNAKIEIIQSQDKNLELKLKQLDTEETAISTELEAVKKVLTKNVESSFKTFNA